MRIFVVQSKLNKDEETIRREQEKLLLRVKRKYPNEVTFNIINPDAKDSETLEELLVYMQTLTEADLVIFEPRFKSKEASVIKSCCEVYDIPYMMASPNAYD